MTAAEERRKRLDAALRTNLHRRKAQARSQGRGPEEEGETPGEERKDR